MLFSNFVTIYYLRVQCRRHVFTSHFSLYSKFNTSSGVTTPLSYRGVQRVLHPRGSLLFRRASRTPTAYNLRDVGTCGRALNCCIVYILHVRGVHLWVHFLIFDVLKLCRKLGRTDTLSTLLHCLKLLHIGIQVEDWSQSLESVSIYQSALLSVADYGLNLLVKRDQRLALECVMGC